MHPNYPILPVICYLIKLGAQLIHVWQVWCTPGFQKSVNPMQLHRTYGQCHADVTALDWSQDSKWLAAVSKDLSAR